MQPASTIATWFLVFLSYAFVGWVIEMFDTSFRKRKVNNRGFLIGPICPIYGFGAIIMTLILHNIDNVFTIFVVAILSSAVLEYFTSYAMEKLFRVRWWDYSDRWLNVRGRICAANLVWFGILGVLVVRIINPFLFGLYSGIDPTIRIIIAASLFTLLLIDLGFSLWLINVCRVTVGTVQLDATDEITANVREVLMNHGRLARRLVKAFPEMEAKRKTPRKRRSTSTAAKSAKKSSTRKTTKPAKD